MYVMLIHADVVLARWLVCRGMSEYLGKTFEDVILGDMDQLAKSGIDVSAFLVHPVGL